ncbi:response regulator [Flavobacterium algoritolerans]|jgi:CheY-like chemotaxis protein|uniref:Response regulator n=1 Tax=Flavobacterium algoritolerans TaxID=3041254 RepID=A0ABT6VC20_9FLAO|nr:response regulator [Flavobacterium algoritolerans]MDI5895776.1 response regulator [Flavobacterium algoritolerans]
MKNELEPKFEKVIIIDDNPIERYCFSRIVLNNNFGKKVIEFSLASEAISYLENQKNTNQMPQIIFIDLYMPHFSGFEFLEAYDKLPLTVKNNSKVFIISNTIDDVDIARVYRDQNVVSFQQKPITKKFLDRIIPEKIYF